jgi:hypothetical protein
MAAHELRGRRAECAVLDELAADVRSGRGQALLIRGDAGFGKSALLDYLVAHSTGCRIARAAGVESEMELPFAGLHLLCAPMLDLRDRLPDPQRDAPARGRSRSRTDNGRVERVGGGARCPVGRVLFDPTDVERNEVGLRSLLGAVEAVERDSPPVRRQDLD